MHYRQKKKPQLRQYEEQCMRSTHRAWLYKMRKQRNIRMPGYESISKGLYWLTCWLKWCATGSKLKQTETD